MRRPGGIKISVHGMISISISLFCIAISFIILFTVLLDRGRGLKISRIFGFFILSNIGFMLCDITMRVFRGNTEWYGLYVLRIAAFLHYVFGPLILVSMSFYMLAYISLKVKVGRTAPFIAIFICGLALLLSIVSQFNNMYYYFDEYNIYRRGPLFLLSQFIPMAGLLVNMAIIFYYKEAMRRKVSLIFLSYMAIPFVAMSLHSISHGITLTSIGTTLATLVFYVSVQMEMVVSLDSKVKATSLELSMQKVYYERLQSHIDEVKKAKHDLRHHLTVIQSYIDLDDKERVKTYLNEYVRSFPADEEILFCKNFAVNSIVRYYTDAARNEGINIEAQLYLTENTGISDSDLCIIFGNCIENAIEACRRLEDGKFIKISSKIAGKMLTITIDNSFDGIIKENGIAFWSLKRESEGIGISSVKAVVEKYGGTARFEPNDNIFQVSVLLRLREEDV